MIIIKSFMFVVAFLFIIYRIGHIFSYFTNNKNRIFNFLFGFLTFFAVNQIVLTPCILLHTSFKIAFVLTIILDFTLIVVSFFLKKDKQKKEFKFNKAKIFLSVLVCILVGFQMLFTTITYKSNADDSFYIALSICNIDSDAIYEEEPSMGKADSKIHLSAMEQIPSFELQISIISKGFDINPTIICHSLLPMIVIFIAYISYYYFAKMFFDNEKSKIFLIIVSIIFLFTGFGIRFRPGYLLTRIWQGKAIFLNVGITMVLAALIKFDKDSSKENIVILFISNLFSIALSSTAIFLLPFTYLAFGVLKLIQRKWKDILKLIISFIPVIVYVIIFYILSKCTSGNISVPRSEVDILEAINNYNSKTYIIYYAIATILILFIGSKDAKRYFVYAQIINALTIWNPMFSNFIARNFTSSATFWRVLWLVPIEFAIAYSIVKIFEKIKNNKIRLLYIIVVVIALIVPGKFIYSFKFTKNLENIPQDVVNQTNYILEQEKDEEAIMVLAPQEPLHSCYMRLISNKINLICSRDMYLSKIKDEQEIEERRNLSQIYYGVYNYSTEEFNNLIEKYSIDWIIVDVKDENLLNYVRKSCMNEVCQIDDDILFRK